MTAPAPSSGLLLAAWRSYRTVLPAAARQGDADGQALELTARNAFYAGAATVMHGIMAQLGAGTRGDPTPEDEALLVGILRELDEYAAGVVPGQA